MRIDTKVLKILSLMANTGPQYGGGLVELAPDLFSDVNRLGGLSRRGAPTTPIYTILRRMETAKLIQLQPNFKPDIPDQGAKAGSRKWYTITAAGRKVLQEARAVLEE